MKYMKAKQQIKVKIVPTVFPIEYKNYAYYKNKSDGYKIIELLNNKK